MNQAIELKRYEFLIVDAAASIRRKVRVDAVNAVVARTVVMVFPGEQVTFREHRIQRIDVLPWRKNKSRRNKVSASQLLLIAETLSGALAMGVPLEQALLRSSLRIRNPQILGVIAEIIYQVTRKGCALGEAMLQSTAFSSDIVESIKAGETSGKLEEILQLLAQRLTARRSMMRKVVSGCAYPLLLLIVALVAFLVLGVLILPETALLFEESGYELPLVTKLLINTSIGMTSVWWRIPVLIVGVIGWVWVMKRMISADLGVRMMAGIPQIGALVCGLLLLRPLQTWIVLSQSGIPLVAALVQAAKVCRHGLYQRYFMSLANALAYGMSLEDALRRHRAEIPQGIELAAALGGVSDTGNLSKPLSLFLRDYEEQMQVRLDYLPKMLEPILLTFVFGIILLVVIAAVLPGLEFLRQSLSEM